MVRHWGSALLLLLTLAGCGRVLPEGGSAPAPAPVPASPPVETPARYDLVIRGGTIIDGTGSPGQQGDLAIQGDRIAAVGSLGKYEAAKVIDATGLVVAPGFINPHSHTHDEAINPFQDLDAAASLMQGITTEFGGVDGRSPVAIAAEFERLSRDGTGVNFALFLGQGSVRGAVMGSAAGQASPDQLEAMKRLVRQGMEEGAFGLSTGLEYRPGSYADTEEIAALATETKAYGGIYSTHLRSEGDRIIPALQEALAIGQKAGVPVNLSHLKIVHARNWAKENEVVGLIEEARRQGQQVFADIYPYLAPDYAINRPLTEWAGVLPPEYLLIVGASDPSLLGKTVAQATEQQLAGAPNIRVVALVSSEAAMLRFYKADWSLVSTDGESQPKLNDPARAMGLSLHRRSYGSYPMLLGHYVREKQVLTLEEAIRKSTGQVADWLGLKSRGYVKPGQYADIVLFDAKTVADRTTWLDPQQYPEGIQYVLVNGKLGVDQGRWVEGRPGRVVRRGE